MVKKIYATRRWNLELLLLEIYTKRTSKWWTKTWRRDGNNILNIIIHNQSTSRTCTRNCAQRNINKENRYEPKRGRSVKRKNEKWNLTKYRCQVYIPLHHYCVYGMKSKANINQNSVVVAPLLSSSSTTTVTRIFQSFTVSRAHLFSVFIKHKVGNCVISRCFPSNLYAFS